MKISTNNFAVRVALLTVLVGLLVATTVSLVPIRWDIKSLRMGLIQTNKPIQKGANIILITATNESKYGHAAKYGLDMHLFPNGRSVWLVSKDGYSPSAWQPDYLIGKDRAIYRVEEDGRKISMVEQGEALIDKLQPRSVVFSDEKTMADTLNSWPKLNGEEARVLSDGKISFVDRPRIKVTAAQLAKILAFVFFGVTLAALLISYGPPSIPINVALALPCTLIVHTYLVHLLGFATADSMSWAVLIELFAAIAINALMLRRGTVFKGAQGYSRAGMALGASIFAVYFMIGILRLDFDGDLFTHWLPAAQSHHLAGRHDVGELFAHYGGAHETTYPPGFPIFISTLMWVSGISRDGINEFSDQLNVMVFLYRTLLLTLQFSCILMLSGIMSKSANLNWSIAWLIPSSVIVFIAPAFTGQTNAGEVYLVPVAVLSILCFLAGGLYRSDSYFSLGVVFSAFLLFTKNDAMLILPLLILPWYVACRSSVRDSKKSVFFDMGLFFILVSVVAVIRFQLASLGIDSNFMFHKVRISEIFPKIPLLAKLLGAAFKALLESNYWLPLFVILPLSCIVDCLKNRRFNRIFIPVGIFSYLLGMVVIYVFSRSDPIAHLETSYLRLVQVAVVSSIIYSIQVASDYIAATKADYGVA